MGRYLDLPRPPVSRPGVQNSLRTTCLKIHAQEPNTPYPSTRSALLWPVAARRRAWTLLKHISSPGTRRFRWRAAASERTSHGNGSWGEWQLHASPGAILDSGEGGGCLDMISLSIVGAAVAREPRSGGQRDPIKKASAPPTRAAAALRFSPFR